MSLLSVQDLTVTFGMQTVLRDISFDVSAGETLAVIGESGCGKTVLLKTLMDLIQPTWGRVVFEGQELGKLTEAELTKARTNYGFVFQMAALFDSMTIEENLLFPMVQHTKQPRQEMMNTVLKLLDEVGLSTNILPKHPAELSGGDGPGACPAPENRPLRRANDRVGPDHDRRDQSAYAENGGNVRHHERHRDTRHDDGPECGGSGDHTLPDGIPEAEAIANFV